MSYRIAIIDELQDIAYRRTRTCGLSRPPHGREHVGANAWTASERGSRLMPEHREDPAIEELYAVLRGRARFDGSTGTVDGPVGTLVFVGAEIDRTTFAEEAGTTVLAVGGTIGPPYEAGGWEVWAEFHPAYEAGDYEGVIERAREPLEASGYATPLYNLACCEAQAGRTEDAIGHLRVAFSGGPASVKSQRRTPTSTRSGTSRRFASWSASGSGESGRCQTWASARSSGRGT